MFPNNNDSLLGVTVIYEGQFNTVTYPVLFDHLIGEHVLFIQGCYD